MTHNWNDMSGTKEGDSIIQLRWSDEPEDVWKDFARIDPSRSSDEQVCDYTRRAAASKVRDNVNADAFFRVGPSNRTYP